MQKWVRIAYINLLIVAFLGVIMRYKIAYYLPFVEQKYFLHAHSHFAFTGWITYLLMILMWGYLYNYLPAQSLKKYKWLAIANLAAAYGMLVSFCWQGYGIISIIFSTLSIGVSYVFAFVFWGDLNKIKVKIISTYWFKAALLFNVLSSGGAFFLSYLMANKIQHPNWFLASTYYFLHFQYNGWFFFACMGLFSEWLKENLLFTTQQKIFWVFALACIPAYFLSALWLPIPIWVYIVVVLAAVSQLTGWIMVLRSIFLEMPGILRNISKLSKYLFILSAIALSIKFLLQLGSVIPSLSKLAFGFRPVVIGYLHLMFLGVITIFAIGYCKARQFIVTNKTTDAGIIIFVSGIIINELLLMVQGLAYMNYLTVSYINEMLLGAALVMFGGLIIFNLKLSVNSTSLLP